MLLPDAVIASQMALCLVPKALGYIDEVGILGEQR